MTTYMGRSGPNDCGELAIDGGQRNLLESI